jgi:glutathione S-transferase
MITLFQAPAPGWGRIGNMSPYCLKLEMWLRLAKIPYEVKAPNLRKSPKGKMPYIYDDARNLTLGDSGLIIEDLKKTYNVTLDQKLTNEQTALSVAVQRMLEEHLYFGGVHTRWSDDESFAHLKTFFNTFLPPVIGGFILTQIRKSILKSAYAQGMGRHSRPEIDALCRADVDALSTLLGDRPFLHGAEPTTIDATIYGFMANFLWVPWTNDLKTYGLSKSNLVAHTERMHKLFEDGAGVKVRKS